MNFKSLGTLACLVSIVACAAAPKDGGASSPAPKDEGQVFSLVGLANTTYKSNCKIDEDKNRSDVEFISFGENTFEKIWMNFDGHDCNAGKKRTTYSYKFKNVEKEVSPHVDGWDTYVYIYESVTAMTHAVIVTKNFNKDKGYGYDDWVMNEPKEVSGRRYDEKSEAKAAKGEVRALTVKIKGNTMGLARYKKGKVSTEDPLIYQKK